MRQLLCRKKCLCGVMGTVRVVEKQEEEIHITIEKWPVLMEGDGGREVHALHVVLTVSANFFQVCFIPSRTIALAPEVPKSIPMNVCWLA